VGEGDGRVEVGNDADVGLEVGVLWCSSVGVARRTCPGGVVGPVLGAALGVAIMAGEDRDGVVVTCPEHPVTRIRITRKRPLRYFIRLPHALRCLSP